MAEIVSHECTDQYGEYTLHEYAGPRAEPAVSVVMSVWNGKAYLAEAIDSILSQTFTDFEFIVVDDASNDGTSEIIRKFLEQDSRIRLIQQKHLGLTKSLNRAFGLVRGSLIARQDADDISLPERFANEVKRLSADSRMGVCGVRAWVCGEDSIPVYSFALPETHSEIKRKLLAGINPIYHGAVMFRRELIRDLDPIYRFPYAQDFDLWLRLIDSTTFGIVDMPLYIYRRHGRAVGSVAAGARRQAADYMLKLHQNGMQAEANPFWEEFEQGGSRAPEVSGASYVQGYMKLLAGKRKEAAGLLRESSGGASIWLFRVLASLPFGCSLARVIHGWFANYSGIQWWRA